MPAPIAQLINGLWIKLFGSQQQSFVIHTVDGMIVSLGNHKIICQQWANEMKAKSSHWAQHNYYSHWIIPLT